MLDVEILDAIKMKHVSPKPAIVTLLHNVDKRRDGIIKLQTIDKWCQKEGWNCVHYSNIRGSEADVIVMYDVQCYEMEPYSRAKNALIILQK